MRVVYLADAPYIHTRRWVQHFARLGWDAHVISFRPAEIEGATVHYIDGLEAIGKARYVVHARRVRTMIRDLQPDLLHALHLTSYGFLAGLSGFQPSIVSVWGTDVLEAPTLSPLHRWITKHALAHAGAITATGRHLAEATKPYAPADKPILVIPYGVNLDTFAPDATGRRQSHGVTIGAASPRSRVAIGAAPPRSRLAIGAVSRLSPEKGFDHLLRAVALLRDRSVDLEVVLAGDGPARATLETLAAELALTDRVRFLGEIDHGDVPAALRQLDIFAMPSTWEGFGVSAIEASAMRLPVVASNIHGIPDVVIDGQTGILVPPADAPALAAAIERLAADASLRTAMGAAGRAFVEREYRWQDNARLMEDLYARMTARRPIALPTTNDERPTA